MRERPEFQQAPEPFRWPGVLIEPFRLRIFRALLAMYLLAFVALDCIGSIVVLFVRNYLGREADVGIVGGLVVAVQVIAMPFYLWLVRRWGKAQGYVVGACLWMLAMLASLLLSPEMPSWTIYVFATLVGFGMGGISLSIYAMFPDVPDVDELVSGRRREGMYSSLFTLARKFSSAIALFLVAQVIGVAGYLPPQQVVTDGVTQLVHQPQSQSFLLILRLLFAFLPVCMLLLGSLAARRYSLSRSLHAHLGMALEARRRTGSLPKGTELLAERLLGNRESRLCPHQVTTHEASIICLRGGSPPVD